jgi:flagellar biosynthesis protein FlhG
MAFSVAVASGKGGVGKTSIAINVALSLAKMGYRTCLLDTDFGVANAHILLGIDPKQNMSDMLQNQASLLDLCTPAPCGLRFISGGSGMVDILNLDSAARFQIVRSTEALAQSTDVLVVDVPAGASDATLNFVSAADRPLIVLVGEPTSFMDAYSLIKAAYLEANVKHFYLAINMANNETQAQDHFARFRDITSRFLDVQLTYVGHIPYSNALRKSVIERKPIMTRTEASRETVAFQKMAKSLLTGPLNEINGIRYLGAPKAQETAS